MKNFNYSIPTRILFGKDKIEKLGAEVNKYGSKVLLVYGMSSIKKSGLYELIKKQLLEFEIECFELSGVDPNPRIESVYKGAKICKENGVELIIAAGGGSVIDCAKAIAVQAKYDGDVWEDFYENHDLKKLKEALPVASILTLAATGSEMNGNSVISKMETNEKLAIGHEKLKPVFSILDPTYTFTVNKFHTAAGVVDIMSHTFEQYFSPDKGGYLQSRLMEGILKTAVYYGPLAIKDPDNYEARANLMWGGSLALNGLMSYGKLSTDWATHGMEHELSAQYDITHGMGLGILTPYWMEYVLSEENAHRFVDYAKNVWGITGECDMAVARKSIEKTREFFRSLGIPTTLTEVGIDSEKFEIMAINAVKYGPLGTMKSLEKEDVLTIYRMAL
jgi:alcohol dehydrogenase YqhD (iron-dependent ADH family)